MKFAVFSVNLLIAICCFIAGFKDFGASNDTQSIILFGISCTLLSLARLELMK